MMARLLVVSLMVVCSCAHLNRPEPIDATVEQGQAEPSVSTVGEPGRLRLVTFNVHGEDGARIARAILTNPVLRDADIIFVQEIEKRVGDEAPRIVARRLGFHFAYAPGYGLSGGGSHGVAILSRFALADVEVIALPHHQVVFNSARRVALSARVRVDERDLRLYNVHLDNRISAAARVAQLAPVVAHAGDSSVSVIIAGDFNTSPFRWLAHVVPIPGGKQQQRLESFIRDRGFATPVTGSGPTSKWLSMRLDGIFTRDLEVADYAVERSVRISDHLPLWADFHWPPAPQA